MGLFPHNFYRCNNNHDQFGMPINVVHLIMICNTPFNVKVRRLMFRHLNEVNSFALFSEGL